MSDKLDAIFAIGSATLVTLTGLAAIMWLKNYSVKYTKARFIMLVNLPKQLRHTTKQERLTILIVLLLAIFAVGYGFNLYIEIKEHNLEVARESRLCKTISCRKEVRRNYIVIGSVSNDN